MIGETVSALFGQPVLAFYTHLKNHYAISKHVMPAHLPTLHEVLQNATGLAVSTTVERAMARALYSRVRLKTRFTNSSSLTLLEYVDEAKRNLAEPSHSRL